MSFLKKKKKKEKYDDHIFDYVIKHKYIVCNIKETIKEKISSTD